MKVEGTLTVAAPVEEVWPVFLDPARLCLAVPGCESARRIDETHYEATLSVKVQFMTIRSLARGTVLEAMEPHHLVVELVGEPIAMAGAFLARLTVDLSALDATTHIAYTLDLTMMGRLASLGEAIVRTTAQRQSSQLAANLAAMFPGTAV